MAQPSQPTLLDLLPAPTYLLAYAIPLLLFSLIFTLAGTFLTLDRTRSFPSHLPIKNSKGRFHFEGGVGGLIGGYLLGAHLSTALALLVPATTAVPPLSHKSFLAIWVLSVLVTTPLASRYRYVAYLFHGISGGTCISLALIIPVHQSLPSRIILTVTVTSLFSLLTLFFSSSFGSSLHLHHSFSRLCTASTGAFGLSQSIALLLSPPEKSWSSPWDRLFIRDASSSSSWGNGRERGLSAAFWILTLVGCAADWALNRRIGECPDERWDECLARYADGLSTTKNHPGRQGVFRPFRRPASVWERWFGSVWTKKGRGSNSRKEGVFADEEAAMMYKAASTTATNTATRNVDGSLAKKNFFSSSSDEQEGAEAAAVVFSMDNKELLKKKKNSVGFATTTKKKKPVRFGDPFSSDSDDEDATANGGDGKTPRRSLPPPSSQCSSSVGTLVDRGGGGGGGKVKKSRPAVSFLPQRLHADMDDVGVDVLDYDYDYDYDYDKEGALHDDDDDGRTDYEDYREDEHEAVKKTRDGDDGDHTGEGKRNVGAWTPGFLKRHAHAQAAGPPLPSPSLIKAIDRIQVEVAAHAQHARRDDARAFHGGGGGATKTKTKPKPKKGHEGEEGEKGWEELWREVASMRGAGADRS